MQYWDESKTLVEGCSPISEGCLNCWRKGIDHRFGREEFVGKDGNWTGEIRTREDRLPELLKGRKPKVIQIWNDLFHEQVPFAFIRQAFETFCQSKHTILVLTKRAERMCDTFYQIALAENIWRGITIETQRTADERTRYLLQVAGKRWLSVEPCLSNINVLPYLLGGNQNDRKGKGIYDSSSTWCVQCGRQRECLEAWSNDGREQEGDGFLYKNVHPSHKCSNKHQGRIPNGNVLIGEKKTVWDSSSQNSVDDTQPFRYSKGTGNQSQGWQQKKSSPLKLGGYNSISKCTSFIPVRKKNQSTTRREECLCKTNEQGCHGDSAIMETKKHDSVGHSENLQYQTNNNKQYSQGKYLETSPIAQVIVGCETGRNARPCKIEWIESIVDQCKQARVPVFVKAVNINGKITSDITKFPESLRLRELAWKGGE